jgi:hypothetical protein
MPFVLYESAVKVALPEHLSDVFTLLFQCLFYAFYSACKDLSNRIFMSLFGQPKAESCTLKATTGPSIL